MASPAQPRTRARVWTRSSPARSSESADIFRPILIAGPPHELALILRGKVGGKRMLAQLQRPDVGRDAPPVAGRDPCGEGIHGPETAGHHIEEMTDGLLAEL